MSFYFVVFLCDLCGKTHRRKYGIRRHIAARCGSVQCNKCYKVLRKGESHVDHPLQHIDSHPFHCDLCSEAFTSYFNIGVHIRTTHFNSANGFKCDRCSYAGKTRRLLRRHKLVHTKPCKCRICGKSFRGNSNLDMPLRQHVEPGELRCFCGKEFRRRGDLSRHKLIVHDKKTHEKTFKCSQCPYAGKSRNNLSCHAKTHRQIFACTFCDKISRTKAGLAKHSKTHSTEA